MSVIKRAIKFVVFSNLWIAIAAAGFTLNTYLLFNREVNEQVVLLVFLATFSVYNLQRIVKHYFQNKNYSSRHKWILKNANILFALVVLCSITTLFLFFEVYTYKNFISLLPFSVVSLLYSVSLFSGNKSLRDLPFVKIFLIAVTWAVTSVVLPIIELGLPFSFYTTKLFVFNFLFIFAIIIPFDIRDVELDNKATKTLPQYFGVNRAVDIAMWMLSACLIISIVSFFTLGQVVPLVLALVLVVQSKKKQTELFYSGLIDGVVLLFPLFNYFF